MEFEKDDYVQFRDGNTICRGHIAFIGEGHVTIDVISWRSPADAHWRHGFYKRHLTTNQARAKLEKVSP